MFHRILAFMFFSLVSFMTTSLAALILVCILADRLHGPYYWWVFVFSVAGAASWKCAADSLEAAIRSKD